MLLIERVVADLWDRRQCSQRIEVHVEPFVCLAAPQSRAPESEAKRVRNFLDAEVELSVGKLVGEVQSHR